VPVSRLAGWVGRVFPLCLRRLCFHAQGLCPLPSHTAIPLTQDRHCFIADATPPGNPLLRPRFRTACPWPASSRSPWWFAAVAVSVSVPHGTSGTKAGRIGRLTCGKRDDGDPVSSPGLYHHDWALYHPCLSTSSFDDTEGFCFSLSPLLSLHEVVMMYLPRLVPIGLAAYASAQALTDVLAANSAALSTLTSKFLKYTDGECAADLLLGLLQTVPDVISALSTVQNVTIFAPSNDAFAKLMARNPRSAELSRNPRALTAVLQYHVLLGRIAASDFTEVPKFPSTLLSAPFANVTGGQRLQLAFVNNGAMLFSGYKQAANVVTAVRNPSSDNIIEQTTNQAPRTLASTAASSTSSTLSSRSPPTWPKRPSTPASPPSPAPSRQPSSWTASTACPT